MRIVALTMTGIRVRFVMSYLSTITKNTLYFFPFGRNRVARLHFLSIFVSFEDQVLFSSLLTLSYHCPIVKDSAC